MAKLVPIESIVSKIVFLRDEKVILDSDLAELYGVETKQLKRAVRRNINRFPEDFMFQLSKEEYQSLRSQFGTLKRGAHAKYPPMAFTEQGVAMLSSVLNSERAIEVNVAIIRAFIHLRKMVSTHKDLKKKIVAMERKYDEQFAIVFEAIKQLLEEDEKPKRKIGYVKERKAPYKKKMTKKLTTKKISPKS